VLGYFKRKSIAKWRERVGNEEATRISTKAAGRGTKFHNLVEKYFHNIPKEQMLTETVMPDLIEMFRKAQPAFERIDNIHYIECPLYSETMKVAGRCDLIAEFDGELAIIDHKTSLKEKREEWIQEYLEQKTCYALMHEERFGTPIEKIVTIIIADDLNVPQLFIRNKSDYKDSLFRKLEEYHRSVPI
jgi:genome maintenance exonuclease 1